MIDTESRPRVGALTPGFALLLFFAQACVHAHAPPPRMALPGAQSLTIGVSSDVEIAGDGKSDAAVRQAIEALPNALERRLSRSGFNIAPHETDNFDLLARISVSTVNGLGVEVATTLQLLGDGRVVDQFTVTYPREDGFDQVTVTPESYPDVLGAELANLVADSKAIEAYAAVRSPHEPDIGDGAPEKQDENPSRASATPEEKATSAEKWRRMLHDEYARIERGKYVAEEFALLSSSKRGRSLQLKLHAEGPADGTISRDNFVSFASGAFLASLVPFLAAADADGAGVTMHSLEALIGEADIEVNVVMTSAGLQIEVVADERTERRTQTWADVFSE